VATLSSHRHHIRHAVCLEPSRAKPTPSFRRRDSWSAYEGGRCPGQTGVGHGVLSVKKACEETAAVGPEASGELNASEGAWATSTATHPGASDVRVVQQEADLRRQAQPHLLAYLLANVPVPVQHNRPRVASQVAKLIEHLSRPCRGTLFRCVILGALRVPGVRLVRAASLFRRAWRNLWRGRT
jgi:hypothetical protein